MLRKIADYIPTLIWTADEKMNINFINKTWMKFTHLPRKEIVGKKWLDKVHPEDRAVLDETIEKIIKKPEFFSVQFRMLHHSGNYRWILLNGMYTTDNLTGKPMFIGSGNEIHKLVKSDQNKSEFMNFASHEIKTPLTAIQTYLEIIEKRVKENNLSDLPDFIQKAKNNTKNMADLINSFLDITRAQVGKMSFAKRRENIADIILNVTGQSRYIYKNHKIILSSVKSADVFVDKKRITQVLDNIIANAARYSPKKSIILISQEVKNKKAVIKIKDQGIGIPKSEFKKIFKKYYQLKKDPYKIVGMGMGLFIAKSILINHKGTIKVESKVGKGSTFTIELPIISKRKKNAN